MYFGAREAKKMKKYLLFLGINQYEVRLIVRTRPRIEVLRSQFFSFSFLQYGTNGSHVNSKMPEPGAGKRFSSDAVTCFVRWRGREKAFGRG